MKTITIHWSIAFALPLVGAFIARLRYANWQAWVAAAAMSLISFLMIIFIGRETFQYAMIVIIAMWLIGAFLPDIWQGATAAVRAWLSRPRNVFILAGIILGALLFHYNPRMLEAIVCSAAILWLFYRIIRSMLKF